MTLQIKNIILAPMEGVIDDVMRELLTSINHYDLCITEFVRVVKALEPKQTFYKICPELHQQGKTKNGTKVRVQLLGQYPNALANNAIRAIELGSHGVDLNFGCPAKTVNKSKGGAVLLDDPQLIYRIISEVKNAVGKENIVSAKVRLGFDDTSLFSELLDAINQSAPDMLTIHARTKRDGYKPPAHWHFIEQATQKLSMEIIANGEIWSYQDAINCLKTSNTHSLMLGRGALALPNLANHIRHNEAAIKLDDLKKLIIAFYQLGEKYNHSFYFSSRLKQWLKYLKYQFVEADSLFDSIKKLENDQEILAKVEQL